MFDLKDINKRLLTKYGRFSTTDFPRYRLVWSTDQFEKRWTKYTKDGFELIQPEVRELPKYRQTDPDRWVVEKCWEVIPEVNPELVEKISFEPLHIFKGDNGEYIQPSYRAVEFVIEMVHKAMATLAGAEYKDPLESIHPKDQADFERERIGKLSKELFGNETDISDALGHREGIVVPHEFTRN